MKTMKQSLLPAVGQKDKEFRPFAKKNQRRGSLLTLVRTYQTCLALLLVNTLVFGQYIPPHFIHIFLHTQICMYIHTYKRVINWIFVHVCIHTFS